MTEDEMVGWHHWLNGHEFEQAPGVGDGQGALFANLRGLLMVALRSKGNWRWEGPLGTPLGLVHWKRPREASGVPCLNPRRGLTLLSPVCRDPAIGV